MNEDKMNMDPSQPISKSKTSNGLTTGPFSSSVSKLSGSSRCIPSEKDFHFYNNFDEFKNPIRQITRTSHSMLQTIGTSARVWGKQLDFPDDADEGFDWLVNVNDELLEQFDSSVDEFQSIRKKEEEMGKSLSHSEDSKNGFQVVRGKKNRAVSASGLTWKDDRLDSNASLGVKVAVKDKKTTGPKPKVPFHIPTIRRPQEEFNILVNNSNQPFEHVWLQRSEDGLKFIHPLENLSVLDFVDKDLGSLRPTFPPSLDTTPFKLVEEVKDLKELAAKLRAVNEFAVDLEHNQYRSFQGLTCLMQISTRTEDFVVDTLKLRIHIGPYLREVFKDPTKRKVMHGADKDIIWLQRDFGIYVCNLFDTGQASKVLKLERNSLEHLLHHFCQVSANKEYQNADWRLRPLPEEMMRYAREDTHYLLYIYDVMRLNLFSMPKTLEALDTPLVEVYKRSYDVCLQLYEKELLTENSYLYIYGLQGSGFNAHQLAVVAGLCEWRDVVARAEDESTGYILPNKALLEIAKQLPVTSSKLRRLVKSKHPYVERNLDTVVSIIRSSLQNTAAFEAAVEQLKESLNASASTGVTGSEGREASLPLNSNLPVTNGRQESIGAGSSFDGYISERSAGRSHSNSFDNTEKLSTQSNNQTFDHHRESLTITEQSRHPSVQIRTTVKDSGATVQVLKKPVGAFGALLGNLAPKRKYDTDQKGKEDAKLEQIRSSVSLPFQSFSGSSELWKPVAEIPSKDVETQSAQATSSEPSAATSRPDEIIMLEGDSDVEESRPINSKSTNEDKFDSVITPVENIENEDEPMSLSELSSSFQKCLQSAVRNKKSSSVKKTEQPGSFLQVKPFDYDTGRKQVVFGEDDKQKRGSSGDSDVLHSGVKKKVSPAGLDHNRNSTKELQQGKRRQAFPATGNRSATFR